MASSVFVQGPAVLCGLPQEIPVGDWTVTFPDYFSALTGKKAEVKIEAKYIRLFNVQIRWKDQTFTFPEMIVESCYLTAALLPKAELNEKGETIFKFWNTEESDTPTVIEK